MSNLSHDLIERIREFGDRPLLHGNPRCARPTWTGPELADAVESFAAGLVSLGLEPGEKVGLVADNFDLWLVADLACLLVGAVDVPRAGDAPVEEISFVIEHSRCRFLLIEDGAQWQRLKDKLPAAEFRAVVVLNASEQTSRDLADEEGVMTFHEVCERGRQVEPGILVRRIAAVETDDLASIVYTSGTTGNPKGVMLSHGNFEHNVRLLPELVGFNSSDHYLSFLPSWHAFERTVEYCGLSAGMAIHYSSKAALRKDLLRVRPTVVAGVPRLWESIASGVLTKTSKLKTPLRQVVGWALASSRRRCSAQRALDGLELDERGRLIQSEGIARLGQAAKGLLNLPGHLVARSMVFGKIRELLGGRIRFLVSGGGALPRHVDEFFWRTDVTLLNGYGLTETAPVVSVRRLDRLVLESSGTLLPETEWQVRAEDGETVLPSGKKGVLWIRGPQVMRGYYENPEATAAVLKDGWFSSGDLATLSEEGDVVICGRAKDTLVLRGGENVEPEIVEAKIIESPWVRDVVVVGHGEKHLAALVLPEPQTLRSRFESIAEDDCQAAADHPDVGSFLHREIGSQLSSNRIFERVSKIALFGVPFSPEGKTLTPTLKKKRVVIEGLYADDIQRMFADGAPEVQRALADPK